MKSSKYLPTEINLLPRDPGIYKFFDKNEKLIYVGKAKNIKKRIANYFNRKIDLSIKTRKMVSQIENIEFTVVNSEYEAFLLENNLIKNNNPKYNILLRDDKTYPYISILNERFPRIISTRKINNKYDEYYGPFSNLPTMYNIIDLIKDIYTVRTCNLNLSEKNIKKNKFKVCLEYHIKNCKGPCEDLQSEQDYNEDIIQIKNILKGNFQEVKKHLKRKMSESAKNLKFEEAQEFKEKIQAIENYYSKSLVINPSKTKDIDVFAITSNNDNFNKAFVSYIKIKKGLITLTKTIEIQRRLDETLKEILVIAIINLREKHQSQAKEIISNIDLTDLDLNTETLLPKIGDKRKLLDLAIKNALIAKRDSLLKDEKLINKTNNILINLKADLNLKNVPKHIECFDNSNLQGTTPVAAMVCFINGKPSKKHYRHFNIKTVIGPNDFASMEEVIERRYKKFIYETEVNKNKDLTISKQKEDKLELPDLILIDGGKGQLNSAIKILKKLGIYEKIEIISIAKRLEEIYKPNDQFPIHLNKISSSLKLIQRIRDEAHRFAITFHKSKREKKSIKSELDNIKGIGPKSVQVLLKNIGSVKKIKETSREKIAKLIGKAKSDIIFNYFEANN